MAPQKSRYYGIDILKSIAIVGVLIIHTAAPGLLSYPLNTADWYFTVFWASIIRFSVPVFFMCSGAVLLDPSKEISTKKMYTKYLPRILLALIFWALIYELFDIFQAFLLAGYLDKAQVWTAVKNLLTCNTHFHLYYLYIIILVYVFVPISRIITKNATKKQMGYALVVWFILGIVLPFGKQFYPFTTVEGIPLQYPINMTYSAIGYGLMGYYLHRYLPIKRYLPYIIGAIGFVIVFGGTITIPLSYQIFSSIYFEGMSPGVALMAIGLFAAVDGKSGLKDATSAVTYLSKASFCIYLVHDFFNIIFRSIGFNIAICSPLFSIPFITLTNLFLSIGIYFILSKIPLVNKYLI